MSVQAGYCGQPSSGQGAAGSLQFILSFGRGRPDPASRVGP
jgi:hypothetical protein